MRIFEMKTLWIRTCVAGSLLALAARAQTTECASVAPATFNQGEGDSGVISGDGRFAAFVSYASDLVPGDTNGWQDVFVRNLQTWAIERVNVGAGGVQANDLSEGPLAISPDGRFVLFRSHATNLVPGDTNGAPDLFLRDRQNGTTERVNVSSGGTQANGDTQAPGSMSADGRYVAFFSNASNLVAGDTNGTWDVFVRDRQSGTTERVSITTGGGQVFNGSYAPWITPDGRFVAFTSDATNLVPGDTNNVRDIFLRDRQAGTTERISVATGGAQGNAASQYYFGDGNAISADGRYVIFPSLATNLVAADTNGALDIFLRDRQNGTTERLSVASGGAQADAQSYYCDISPDGRYVVFASDATNLVPGDLNGQPDVFVRDLQAGATERISVSSSGAEGDSGSGVASISADGRYVVFYSDATNLVGGDGNGQSDIFLRDRSTGRTRVLSLVRSTGDSFSLEPSLSSDGNSVVFKSNADDLVSGDTNGFYDIYAYDRWSGATERISLTSGGGEGNGPSELPSVSSDGRYVAFDSAATNMVAGDTNVAQDVFLRDRQSGTTERVSVGAGGAEANSNSSYASISGDGRCVAFSSYASNLVAGDTNGTMDVFVRDRQAGTTERVSVSSGGAQADQVCQYPAISADGRYVAFMSGASTLVPGDTNGFVDIFVRDRQSGTTERVSVDSGGAQSNGDSYGAPAISADGRYVAFASDASNLVSGDTNATGDIFVRDRQTGTTTRVSVASGGAEANGGSYGNPSISANGRYVAFPSYATNLVAGDTNGYSDVFLRDRLAGTTERLSIATDGTQGNRDSYAPSISLDGRCIAFTSEAWTLVDDDVNLGYRDVFVRDRGVVSAFVSFCAGDGTIAACPCGNSGATGHGCENSSTTGGAILMASGEASLSSDTVHLTSSGEKPTAFSVVLQGSLTVSPLHYGDGLRCVGGTLKRLLSHNAVGGVVTIPQGTDPTLSARSAALGDVIQAGATRNYQVYYRDPSGSFCAAPAGSTFNISNAIAIAWSE